MLTHTTHLGYITLPPSPRPFKAQPTDTQTHKPQFSPHSTLEFNIVTYTTQYNKSAQMPSTIIMSAPINIRSVPSQILIAELFQFPPSPPFASERHACAFPSWPDRPTLCSQPRSVSSQESNISGFWSDVDLLAEPKVPSYKPFQRVRPTINFNDIEFEDDSDDEDVSAESSLSSTPEVQPIKIVKASYSSKSILGDQIRRQRDFNKKTLAQLISE